MLVNKVISVPLQKGKQITVDDSAKGELMNLYRNELKIIPAVTREIKILIFNNS
jgi:hypothetical protein